MSITTITINTVDYISYASIVEANQRLAVDPTRSTAWAALSDDQKAIQLVAATNRLDLFDYSGEKVSATQANQWPRTGATCNGTPVTETDVPLDLENATILLAGTIATTPDTANAGTAGSNIESVRAGTVAVSFFRPTIPGPALQDETAFALIRCLFAGAGATSTNFGLASGSSGTNTQSAFIDRNAPGLTEGWP